MKKLNKIYEEFKELFIDGFHSMLWELIINGTHADKMIAFTTTIQSGYVGLGIAVLDESGYIPAPTHFVTKNYNEATAICERLNEAVFGHSVITALRIVVSSMRSKENVI